MSDDHPTVGQTYTPPPPPAPGRKWPAPNRTSYPLKPSDRMMPDGRIYSGGLNKVKDNQHEHRVVLRWDGAAWQVARPRLRTDERGDQDTTRPIAGVDEQRSDLTADDIPIARLMSRVKGPLRLKNSLIAGHLLGKRSLPDHLPLRRMLAVAAAVTAADRGVPSPTRVFDLLTAEGGDLRGLLVVFLNRRGEPRLVAEADYQPGPHTVIELDELRDVLIAEDA